MVSGGQRGQRARGVPGAARSAGAWARSGPRGGAGAVGLVGSRPGGEAGAVGSVGPGPGLGPGARLGLWGRWVEAPRQAGGPGPRGGGIWLAARRRAAAVAPSPREARGGPLWGQMGLAGSRAARRGVVVRGPEGSTAREGRQLTASGGERAVSEGDSSSIEAAPSPGSSATTISVERGLYLPLGTAGKLWSGPSVMLFVNFGFLRIV